MMCTAHVSVGVVFFLVGVEDQVTAPTKVGGDGEGRATKHVGFVYGRQESCHVQGRKRLFIIVVCLNPEFQVLLWWSDKQM